MKVASSGSARAASSASVRTRAHTGSTLPRPLTVRVCCWAIEYNSPALHYLAVLLSHNSKRRECHSEFAHGSCAFVEEIDHGRFEDLVADGEHVVAAGYIERFCTWDERSQFLSRAGHGVGGADRDQ